MLRDRRVAAALEHAALHAVSGICLGLLEGAVGDAGRLEAHPDARGVHHHEHAGKPAADLADEVARGVLVGEHARRRPVDAQLVLDRDGLDAVAVAERAVGIDEVLRRDEQRQSLGALGGAGLSLIHI